MFSPVNVFTMLKNDFEYQFIKPDVLLSDYVDYFWLVANHSENDKQIIVLPDGRVDILFSYSASEPFHVVLLGLESQATQTTFASQTVIFGVSLKLLAIEYLLHTSISSLLDDVQVLPTSFWEFKQEDLSNFELCCQKATHKISQLIKGNIDNRKRKLFELIYSSKGSMNITTLSEEVAWSSRQINRYFNQTFGISLKSYCNILRFRASFTHLKEGKLFPEQNFTDQAHFIKEVKRFSGVVPKELSKNKNDRFIQFLALPPE